MKIYFVEGVDGAGKTTLIKNLSQYADVKGYSSPPRDWDFEIQILQWERFLKNIVTVNDDTNIVLIDRSPITEFVYRMVIDIRKSDMTMKQFAELMQNYKVEIVYCEADDAFEAAQKRGEDYVVSEDAHKAIEEMYNYFMWTMTMFGIKVHTAFPKRQKVVEIYDKLKGGK